MSEIDRVEGTNSSKSRIEAIKAYLDNVDSEGTSENFETGNYSEITSVEATQIPSNGSMVSIHLNTDNLIIDSSFPSDIKTVEATEKFGNDEMLIDSDHDGVPDKLDCNSHGDLVPQSEQIKLSKEQTLDSDGDGIVDALDYSGNASQVKNKYDKESQAIHAIRENIFCLLSFISHMDLTAQNSYLPPNGGLSIAQMNDMGSAQVSLFHSTLFNPQHDNSQKPKTVAQKTQEFRQRNREIALKDLQKNVALLLSLPGNHPVRLPHKIKSFSSYQKPKMVEKI